jgi:heme A synthase
VTEPSRAVSLWSEPTLDGAAAALFVVFVVFLFLGYLSVYPTVPYSGLAAIPLLGSLVTLFWANWNSHRRTEAPLPSPGT